MIAFLDASALIYLVDGEAPWADAVRATLQQLALEAPDLVLAVSRLSLLECRVAPLRRGDQASLDRFEALFAQPDLLVARQPWAAHTRCPAGGLLPATGA